MLDLEEILKISNDMGVEIVDSTEGKHYILDDYGREVEFNVGMITKVEKENIVYKENIKLSKTTNRYIYKDSLSSLKYNTLYEFKTADIADINGMATIAA